MIKELDAKNIVISFGGMPVVPCDQVSIAMMKAEADTQGDYRVDEFSEPAQRAIRAIGGMSDLGMTHVDEMKWKKKEFAEAYGEYREQQLANPEGFDQKRLGAPDSIKSLVQGVLK